jgi:hypothetical protein
MFQLFRFDDQKTHFGKHHVSVTTTVQKEGGFITSTKQKRKILNYKTATLLSRTFIEEFNSMAKNIYVVGISRQANGVQCS